jgi:tRNA-2-methylthio-N6-dimethylallyladenosine synthase
MKQHKKYYIQTFGCQMNKSDSERLKTVLEQQHMMETQDPKQAQIIILNTCSVRQSAEDRIFGLMKNFGQLKNKNPDLLLGITGCMVGHDTQQKLLKKLPMVDLYFPITEINDLPQKITQLRFHSFANDHKIDSPIAYLQTPAKYENTFEAFVPIMSGCNKFCTYCIVPYARGREYSRSFKEILSEIRSLKDKNVQQVTLLGQNVNSFHPEDNIPSKNNPYKDPFAALLWEVNKIGIPWIHFTAPHPKDMSEEAVDALALPSMVDYLHLPLQSGDDEILTMMNRQYTTKEYQQLVEKIRKIKPHIALGTDIIVGFPGETEKQFTNTLTFYKEIQFDISYHAIYSKRSYTPAAKMKNQIEYETKKERWNRLQHLMETITEKKNKIYKNTTEEILLKEETKGVYIGETRHIKKISIPKKEDLQIGKRYNASIERTATWMLYGTIKGIQ